MLSCGRMTELDRLEVEHAREERDEAARTLLEERRPLSLRRPVGGALPQSKGWLTRFYERGGMVREKKPNVFDHLRSSGAWMVSVDESPLAVLDGMSQTATVPAGFSEDGLCRMYVGGAFAQTPLAAVDTAAVPHDSVDAFAAALRARVPGLPHVTFVNSGAESCEKAFALCRASSESAARTRVLAFQGSFHGRTLLSLHASYNPDKRERFEIEGYGVTFAPFPVWETPGDEPEAPPGFLDAAARGSIVELGAHYGRGSDALLAAEVACLAEVHAQLLTGRFFVVAVEPMQSEGGDRYATARFFQALRLITRFHDVPLLFDEVQCGFGLGGPFAWHSRFGLVDAEGRPDHPDCVTFAKRAQVGVVMSCFEDPEPTSAHTASLIRGLRHAELVTEGGEAHAAHVERLVRAHLEALAGRFPDLVGNPRNTGYAMAFDLPSPEHVAAYLGQRWYRGAVVFAAGSRTIRQRLSRAWDEREIDRLFDAARGTLKWMEANPGQTPPAWEDLPPTPREGVRARSDHETRVREIEPDERAAVLARVIEIEEEVYEPARRDAPEWLALAFDEDGVAVVAEALVDGEWLVVGSGLGAPLERCTKAAGPSTDPRLGRGDTMYSLATTVAPAFRGLGLGREVKLAQLRAASARRRADGTRRYLHATGRNRIGHSLSMRNLNRSLGAYEVSRHLGQYGVPDGEAQYYRLPLGPFVPEPSAPPDEVSVDLAGGLSRPFAEPPASLRALHAAGGLFGPVVNKITICNYVTPAVVRATEWVRALTPDLPHLYLTSSRDEAFDKAVRLLRWHRAAGQVVLGLDGGYVGHTTAAARSLSDPRVHRQGPAYFDRWARVPHPEEAGAEATLAALDRAVADAGGPEAVLGLFVEPVQERTGRVLPDGLWAPLSKWRDRTGVPVVLVETASACYRAGRGPFSSSALDFTPDLIAWWAGGQVGFLHVPEALFVDKPLTFVSTWDGDELSMIRVHHQLRAARTLDVGAAARALDRALEHARLPVRGAGLYKVLDAGDRAVGIERGLAERGFRVRRFPNGAVAVVPPLDLPDSEIGRLGRALDELSR